MRPGLPLIGIEYRHGKEVLDNKSFLQYFDCYSVLPTAAHRSLRSPPRARIASPALNPRFKQRSSRLPVFRPGALKVE